MSSEPLAAASRRGFLRSACHHCAGFGLLGFGASSLAQPATVAASEGASLRPARFARPAAETDEGGLWAMMDREETKLRRSPFVLRDTTLTSYLQQLLCKLGGEHCADVRVHVVKAPAFNATMAPNGMMQIWTGLLLRVDNEAQLAAVLGHELGHYLERHSLEGLRDQKNRAAAAQIIGMFGLAGAIANVAMMAGGFAFSRDQETRADRLGMRLLQDAGYDGRQAALVWDNLLGELKVTGGAEVGTRSLMMATHPPPANRRDELLRLAGDGGGDTRSAELELAVAAHRFGWMQEEIRRGQFEESLVLFDRMVARNALDAQALYARGEVFRQRGTAEDLRKAADDLARASQMPLPPAETFRSLGLLARTRNEPAAAAAAFDKYLMLAPGAADAGLIQHYSLELKP